MTTGTADAEGPVSVEVDVADGRTTVTVSGGHDAAIVVRSTSGEQVYLPPEEATEPDENSPYRPAGSDDSPYDGVPDDSPYSSARDAQVSVGLTATATGFRVVHPEPVTDLRLLR